MVCLTLSIPFVDVRDFESYEKQSIGSLTGAINDASQEGSSADEFGAPIIVGK